MSNNIIVPFEYEYPIDHWSNKLDDTIVLIKSNCGKYITHVKLNPTDRRCYRMIVTTYPLSKSGEPDIKLVHNINPKSELFFNLINISTQISVKIQYLISQYDFVTQFSFAANNSMEEIDNNLILGNIREPFFPHIHLIVRGTKNSNLFGCKYIGPELGELFNMREGKVKWDDQIKEELKNNLKNLFSNI